MPATDLAAMLYESLHNKLLSLPDETKAVELDQSSDDGQVRRDAATEVRALWSEKYLYLRYQCQFTKLTVFEPAQAKGKRVGQPGASLWDRDVVEAFIGSEPENTRHYAEFEVAPTNERLDLMLNLPDRDFSWNSGFDSQTKLDAAGFGKLPN